MEKSDRKKIKRIKKENKDRFLTGQDDIQEGTSKRI